MNNALSTRLTDASLPSLFIDSNGWSHAAWKLEDGIHYAYYNGVRWEESLVVSGSGFSIDDHPIAMTVYGLVVAYSFGNVLRASVLKDGEWVDLGSGRTVANLFIDSFTLVNHQGRLYAAIIGESSNVRKLSIYRSDSNLWSIAGQFVIPSNLTASSLLGKPSGDDIHFFWKPVTKQFDNSSSSSSISSGSSSSYSSMSSLSRSQSSSSSSNRSSQSSQSSLSSASKSSSSSSGSSHSSASSESSSSSSSQGDFHSWLGHVIFTPDSGEGIGTFSSNTDARVDLSCGPGEITGFDFFSQQSISGQAVSSSSISSQSSEGLGDLVVWTRTASQNCEVHSCHLNGLSESLIGGFLNTKINFEKEIPIICSNSNFRSSFYASPSCYLDPNGAIRIACVSDGVAFFDFGEGEVQEGRMAPITQGRISKLTSACFGSQSTICLYSDQDNHSLLVTYTGERNFSSSSSSSLSSGALRNTSSSSSSQSSKSSLSSQSLSSRSSRSSMSSSSRSSNSSSSSSSSYSENWCLNTDMALTCALPNAYINHAYYGTLVASGGYPPYTYMVAPSEHPSSHIALPDGLFLDSYSGIISGTPIVSGSYPLTFRVHDSQLCQKASACVISVYGLPSSSSQSSRSSSSSSSDSSISSTSSSSLSSEGFSTSSSMSSLPCYGCGPSYTLNATVHADIVSLPDNVLKFTGDSGDPAWIDFVNSGMNLTDYISANPSFSLFAFYTKVNELSCADIPLTAVPFALTWLGTGYGCGGSSFAWVSGGCSGLFGTSILSTSFEVNGGLAGAGLSWTVTSGMGGFSTRITAPDGQCPTGTYDAAILISDFAAEVYYPDLGPNNVTSVGLTIYGITIT